MIEWVHCLAMGFIIWDVIEFFANIICTNHLQAKDILIFSVNSKYS